MYTDILADVKADYPGRKILTLSEIAEEIDRSPMAVYKLMDRKNMTIPFKKNGGHWEITIYAWAKWLAEQEEGGEEQTVKAEKVSVEPVKKKQRIGIPIGKILFGFMANIQQMQEQVDFYSDLYRELEGIELKRKFKDTLPKHTTTEL